MRFSRSARLCLLIVSLTGMFLVGRPQSGHGEDWPQFRGPGGQGLAAGEGLPLQWNERLNVTWKTPIPGSGWSSPVILGEQIWMTSALDRARSLRAICVSRSTGEVVHDVEIFRLTNAGRIHRKNGHASPTPVLERGRVYVHFGAHGTACLSSDGTLLWKTRLKYYHHHGPASTPILVDDLLIVIKEYRHLFSSTKLMRFSF